LLPLQIQGFRKGQLREGRVQLRGRSTPPAGADSTSMQPYGSRQRSCGWGSPLRPESQRRQSTARRQDLRSARACSLGWPRAPLCCLMSPPPRPRAKIAHGIAFGPGGSVERCDSAPTALWPWFHFGHHCETESDAVYRWFLPLRLGSGLCVALRCGKRSGLAYESLALSGPCVCPGVRSSCSLPGWPGRARLDNLLLERPAHLERPPSEGRHCCSRLAGGVAEQVPEGVVAMRDCRVIASPANEAALVVYLGDCIGEPWWDRTTDPLIKSPVRRRRKRPQRDASADGIEQAG